MMGKILWKLHAAVPNKRTESEQEKMEEKFGSLEYEQGQKTINSVQIIKLSKNK